MIRRRSVVAVVMCIIAAGITSASAGPVGAADLERAWQDYLHGQATQAPSMTFPHQDCFRRAAAAHGLPQTLLLAVARGESDFDTRARSHANAHGLMQILWPGTAKHLGIQQLSRLYDPCTNVDAGARYLKELMSQYDDNLHLALAAYNYGPGRIQAGTRIPDGANWYSGYIYRHLGYVLGSAADAEPGSPVVYARQRKLTILTFSAPYRAAAFVAQMQSAAPAVRLDWFRERAGRFRVVFSYGSEQELLRKKRLLALAGFSI